MCLCFTKTIVFIQITQMDDIKPKNLVTTFPFELFVKCTWKGELVIQKRGYQV